MIMQTIRDQIKDAMRAKDAVKLDTLRYVLSTLKYVEIEKQRELTDEEAIDALSREVKKRKDAIELFRNSGRSELVTEEEAKLAVIMTLLPAQMTSDEVSVIVDDVIATTGKENMGMVMKEVMARVKGKTDGKMVSDIVKSKMASTIIPA